MRSSILAIILVACSSSEESTSRDTCTQGDNMTAPRLAGGPEASAMETKLRITWDRGTLVGEQLPPAYFAAVSLEDRKVASRAESTGEREIAVFLPGEPSTHAAKTESFTLVFPDRARFTSCRHPGMNDVYELIATITFSADGSTATATFEQKISFGAI